MDKKVFKKGEVIFSQGRPSDCMYDILKGSVGIYKNYSSSQEALLVKLETEQFFGEMGMVEKSLRSATAVALEDDTEVCAITAEDFNDYFKTEPVKVMLILQNMSSRLRELTEEYLQVCECVAEHEQAKKNGAGTVTKELKKYAAEYHALDHAEKNA